MRSPRIWSVAGVGLTLVACVLLLIVPLYSGQTTTDSGTESTTATLLEINGPRALIPLGLFLAFAVVAAVAPARPVRLAALAAYLLLLVLASLTIGSWFLPALGCLVVAEGLRASGPAATSVRDRS